MKKKYIALGLVIIVILVIIGVVALGGGSNSSDGDYQIHIKYDGEWSGTYGGMQNNEYTSKSIDGTGEATYNMTATEFSSAVIQKMDSGNGELTVEILKDGQVVKNQSTTAEYGTVTL